jgi:hypothetical protein
MNCVLADCRFTVALGCAPPGFAVLAPQNDVPAAAAAFGAKPAPQAASSATAKTGETRAKLVWKKREEKKRWSQRKSYVLNGLLTPGKFFRLNFMHNPPPQTAHFI